VPLSCGLQISKDLRQTRIRNEHIEPKVRP